MRAQIFFERLAPTTANGHVLKITTYYSSFNKEEIDKLQEDLRNKIGAGILSISEESSPEENCWSTGTYTDDCICETCDHAYECSGSNIKEDDDDE